MAMYKIASDLPPLGDEFEAKVAAAVAKLKFGYAGANSVDFTDVIALEVNGVENSNVYLTNEAAEYLFWSLGTALGKDMDG